MDLLQRSFDLAQRSLTSAPDATTFRDSKPTLLVSWWCTIYAISIIIIRLCGRYVRAEKIFMEDGIMLIAITPMLIRMALVHVVLLNGTNNTQTAGLSDLEIQQRETGSQLVLASRIFYAATLWAIKYSVSVFLRSLTESVWRNSHQRILRYLHIFLALTFVATVLSDLVACQPFTHYWQVVPDPGPQCRQGYAHLLTTGVLNIVTNLALVIFPLPMILKSRLPGKRKFSIALRLSLPLLSAAFTSYALPRIAQKHYQQTFRTLMASFDILIACLLSNTIVLTSLLQDRGYKKTRYKHGVGRENFTLKGAKGANNGGGEMWGSDEDLMREGSGESRTVVESGKRGSVVMMVDMGGKGDEENVQLQAPKKAKMQEIRVEESWEIEVEIGRPGKK